MHSLPTEVQQVRIKEQKRLATTHMNIIVNWYDVMVKRLTFKLWLFQFKSSINSLGDVRQSTPCQA